MNQPNEQLQGKRHTLAHLLAAATRELFPGAQNAIGPAVEDGFYQDFELPEAISDKDLKKIEKKMREILKTWKTSEGHEVGIDEAKKEFAWNKYKLELIEELAAAGKPLTFYTIGGFVDLCKGGHADDAQSIKPDSFKLDRVAGAYWRGDEKNTMLTRIYGLAFDNRDELDAYLAMREEAKKRDHKKLGQELDLFVFSDLIGSGLPLFTPKGTVLRDELDLFVWQLRKVHGYQRVDIPHITKKDLYETSGHWSKFQDELFKINTREDHVFVMKPMNCPHHIQLFARKKWSYRELPQRYASTTKVYRDEQSGELSGLARVRSVTQDDAHVFISMAQVEAELPKIWQIVNSFYSAFGLPMKLRLSLRDPDQPDKYLGDPRKWDEAEAIIKKVAKNIDIERYEGLGEAAFYGPKLDFMATDSLGREWQVATIQLDMVMPERFGLQFVNDEGGLSDVIMLHAAVMGSIERLLSVLIEHFAGAFPLWLSPVQVMVMPISEKQNEYAAQVKQELLEALPGLRLEVDERAESVGKKIREASMQKIPYMIVVGDKEVEAKKIAVRGRGELDLGTITVNEFANTVGSEINNKT